MAYFGKKLSYESVLETPITLGDGVNTYTNPFSIKPSECISQLNIDNRYYPAMSVRPGRTYEFQSSSAPSTTPNGLGVYNGTYLHLLRDTRWSYYPSSSQGLVDLTTQLTSATGKFLEFNTETNRYIVMTNGTNVYYWDGSTGSAIATTTALLATKYYSIDDRRLYALIGSVLWCSAAGSVTDWTTLDDADSIAITGMVGTGTACVAYNDMVISFSDQTMHILLGDDPLNFQLIDPIPFGCISDRSIVIASGILYFMDYYKYYAFAGGLPIEISQKVKIYLDNINYTYKSSIVASKSGKYIYLSIPYGSTATANNLTLVYDTEIKNWYVWNIGYSDFTQIGEYLYGIDTSGYIWKFNQGTDDDGTTITWEYTTGVWNATPVRNKKVISDIWAVVDLPVGSTLNIYYAEDVDGTTWTLLKTFTASSTEQNTRIQIPTSYLYSINWYRLKLSGTGPCTFHYLEPYARVKKR